MRTKIAVFVLILVSLLSVGVSPTSAQAPSVPALEIKLIARQPVYGNDVPLLLDFSITNTSSSPIRFLTWDTPLGGIFEDFLHVARGAQDIPYIGPIAKRGPPTNDDFIELAPGQTVSASIDLAAYYAIYEAGPYAVAYDVPLTSERHSVEDIAPASVRSIPIKSSAATFQLIAGRVPPASLAPSALQPQFDQCSAAQETDIKLALPAAEKISRAAHDKLRGVATNAQPQSQRYTTWFGAHSSERYAKLVANFEKISDALERKTIGFGCAGSRCKGNIFAYVFPVQPYKIYVCNAFWNADLSGTDSRSGTIVHEVSHFNVVIGTDDHGYGQGAAQNLAKQNPDRALTNADNYEYFAENTPELGM